jgi:Protein of unknown function (DUF1153)
MGQDLRQSIHRWIRASASRRRATLRTKADIAAAVCHRELSVEEACKRYALTLEDFLAYLTSVGVDGLRPPRKPEHRYAQVLRAEDQDPDKHVDLTI